MQIVSSMTKSQITRISSRIWRQWRRRAFQDKACQCHLPALNMPSLLKSLFQQVHLSCISFSAVNHLYSIIFVRFANDNHWQSHFPFAHYGRQCSAYIQMTGLQKSYPGTLQSRTSSHCPHTPHIITDQASIIRVR